MKEYNGVYNLMDEAMEDLANAKLSIDNIIAPKIKNNKKFFKYKEYKERVGKK